MLQYLLHERVLFIPVKGMQLEKMLPYLFAVMPFQPFEKPSDALLIDAFRPENRNIHI